MKLKIKLLKEGRGCPKCREDYTKAENNLSEGMRYHMDNNITLDKNIYRIHSDNFFSLFKEARDLWQKGLVNLTEAESYYISETEIGEFGIFEGDSIGLSNGGRASFGSKVQRKGR